MGKTTQIIRTGDSLNLIDLAIKESCKLVLNEAKYSLNNVIASIKKVGKLDEFPNLVKLNKTLPGVVILSCGGMPVLRLPNPDEKKSLKKSKSSPSTKKTKTTTSSHKKSKTNDDSEIKPNKAKARKVEPKKTVDADVPTKRKRKNEKLF